MLAIGRGHNEEDIFGGVRAVHISRTCANRCTRIAGQTLDTGRGVAFGRKKQFELEGEAIVLSKNQSICVFKGTKVKYSNPFEEPVEYLSVCIPAFSVQRVKREEK